MAEPDTRQLKQVTDSVAKLAEEAAKASAARSEDAQRFGIFADKKNQSLVKTPNGAAKASPKVNTTQNKSKDIKATAKADNAKDLARTSVVPKDGKDVKASVIPKGGKDVKASVVPKGGKDVKATVIQGNSKDPVRASVVAPGGKGVKATVIPENGVRPLRNKADVLLTSGPGAGTAESARDGKAKVVPQNKAGIAANQPINAEGTGLYNTRKGTDMTGIANTAVETAQGTYAESDYAVAKRKIEKFKALSGSGTITRGASKIAVRDSLTRTDEEIRSIEKAIGFKYDKEGLNNIDSRHYRVMERSTMNVAKDYDTNRRWVEEALEKRGINAKNLNSREIKNALQNGEMKKWYHHGAQIKFDPQNSETAILLKELQRLKKDEANIKRIKVGKGGIKNTAKAWIKETTQDSDAAKGFDVAKTTVKAGKATAWALKGAGGTLTNAAVSTMEATGLVKNWATGKHADKKIKQAMAKGDQEAVKKWTVKKNAAAESSSKIRTKAGDFKGKVNYIAKTSASQKVKDGAKLWVEKTKAGQALDKKILTPIKDKKKAFKDKMAAKRRQIRDRILARKSGRIAAKVGKGTIKVLTAPLKFFTITGQIKMIAILIVVFIIIIASIFSGVATAFVGSESTSSQTDEATKEERMAFQDSVYLGGYTRQYGLERTLREKWAWEEETDDGKVTKYPEIIWVYQGRNYSDQKPDPLKDETQAWPEPQSESDTYNNSDERIRNIPYDQATLYKAVLCCYLGFTDNEKDSPEFASTYVDHLFDQILPTEDNAEIDADASEPGQPCPTLRIYVKNCGLQDIMAIDNTDNIWAHTHGSTGYYSNILNTWDGWYRYNTLTGQNEKTDAAESALWFYELSDDEFKELFDVVEQQADGSELTFNYAPQIPSPLKSNDIGFLYDGGRKRGVSSNIAYSSSDISRMLDATAELDPTQRTVMEYAYAAVGCIYTQDLEYRMGPNSFDCSGLAYMSWKQAGVNISYYGATTAAAECQGLEEDGCEVPIGDPLKPGDLIFYGKSDSDPGANGRYKNIYHVAIYSGSHEEDGEIIGECVEAAGTKVGVIHGTMNPRNIVSICRPKY